MTETKNCEVCGASFEKPASCSRANWPKRRFCSMSCKSVSQKGKPSGSKGKTFDRPKHFIPCRICGEPTRYQAQKLAGRVPCDRPECIEASRQLKNERIGERARQSYVAETRPRMHNGWDRVSRISAEEVALTSWFVERGWEAQYRLNTGVHTNKLPRMFRLDFALPDRRLCVEIDGSVHRLRKDRDARRDAMLTEREWRVLRIPSALVRDDIASAHRMVSEWLASLPTYLI